MTRKQLSKFRIILLKLLVSIPFRITKFYCYDCKELIAINDLAWHEQTRHKIRLLGSHNANQ